LNTAVNALRRHELEMAPRAPDGLDRRLSRRGWPRRSRSPTTSASTAVATRGG
jgi:hypothetical protein